MRDVSELTPPMVALVEALAGGCTKREAAKRAGISEASAYRYLSLSVVRRKLADLHETAARLAKDRLLAEMDTAVDVVTGIAKGAKPRSPQQLAAASLILRTAVPPARTDEEREGIRIIVARGPGEDRVIEVPRKADA